jgi:hypothetical protein
MSSGAGFCLDVLTHRPKSILSAESRDSSGNAPKVQQSGVPSAANDASGTPRLAVLSSFGMNTIDMVHLTSHLCDSNEYQASSQRIPSTRLAPAIRSDSNLFIVLSVPRTHSAAPKDPSTYRVAR